MRRILLTLVLLLPAPAQAQFKSYFDVSQLRISGLKEPDWTFRVDENRVRYLCVNAQRCPPPTGIDIKGVVRAEKLPEAFESGALTPALLRKQGEETARRLGTAFLLAEPLTVAGRKGVQMEAAAEMNGTIYFITRWIGEGDRLLDVKVTTRDLALGRKLADTATQSLVPQVFEK